MTIALGVACAHGFIVAADTNVVLSDGARKQGKKVEAVLGRSGTFAIANASEDGNAAAMLSSHLIADLKNNDFNSLGDVEAIVADRMTQWAAPFVKPPSTQLVLAAVIEHGFYPNPEGAALYFCEPPNTVRRVVFTDGYIAVGSGATYTDPLYKMFFPSIVKSLPVRLSEVAYLMYRAKHDSALCGGYTNAVWLAFDPFANPVWINPLTMQNAEDMGPKLDFLLQGTASAVHQSDKAVKNFVRDFGKLLVSLGTSFRQHKFFSIDGEEIV